MTRRSILYLLLILALLLNTVACGPAGDEGASKVSTREMETDQVAEDRDFEPEDGGQIILPLTSLKTLNPLLNENLLYYHFSKLIFEPLFEFQEDLEPRPVLAKDYTIQEEGKLLNISLKEGVLWHDGEEFTADDVAFTINTIKFAGEDKIYGGENINRIARVEVMGPYELNISFNESFSLCLETLTFPIIPRHRFGNVENRAAYGQALLEDNYTPIGTGPYKFNKYDKFKTIELESYSSYREGKAHIDKVVGKILADEELILTAFESGQLDLAIPLDIDWEKYNQNENLRIYEFVSENYEFLGLNFHQGVFAQDNSKGLRKALAYGIDRQKLIRNIYLGHATQAEVPIHPLSWLLWEDANVYGYSPARAKGELKKSGWENLNEEGFYINEDGEELRIRLLTNSNNSLRLKVADMIADDLAKIGIRVVKDYPDILPEDLDQEILDQEWEVLNNKLLEKDFDMVLIGWNLSTMADLNFAFHSNEIKSGRNFINYANEEMDKLLLEALAATSRNNKVRAYKKLQSHIVSELPYISLFFKNQAILLDKKIKGPIEPSFFNYYRNINQWYVPKDYQKDGLE